MMGRPMAEQRTRRGGRGQRGPLARIWSAIKLAVLVLILTHVAYLVLLRWVDPPLTWTQLGAVIDGDGLTRDYVPLDRISPHIRLAVIAAEDQRFPAHGGFDVHSIRRALEHNARDGAALRGASTISQQTAKNVFLWQERSWLRKGLETYLTFATELVWSKERILELYLNVIEMGRGVYGIEAAARHYYGKSAADLTRVEAARIASCLPNPKQQPAEPPSRHLLNKTRWVLAQMEILERDPGVKALLR